jgi:hypothetical protein
VTASRLGAPAVASGLMPLRFPVPDRLEPTVETRHIAAGPAAGEE